MRDDRPGRRADRGSPSDEARRRPLQVLLMRLRPMPGVGAVATARVPAGVRGDARPVVKHLDHRRGHPDHDHRADELIGHTIEVFLDRDVVIDVDRGPPPFGVLVPVRRERAEREAIRFVEEGTSRARQFLKEARVEVLEPVPNRGVEFGERREGVVSQGRQDLALDDLHGGLDLRLGSSSGLHVVKSIRRQLSPSPIRSIRCADRRSISSSF